MKQLCAVRGCTMPALPARAFCHGCECQFEALQTQYHTLTLPALSPLPEPLAWLGEAIGELPRPLTVFVGILLTVAALGLAGFSGARGFAISAILTRLCEALVAACFAGGMVATWQDTAPLVFGQEGETWE